MRERRSRLDGHRSVVLGGRSTDVYAHSDHCDPRASDGIYVIRPNGSGRRRLPINTSLDDEYASPGLSPSARRLAFGDGPFATYISSLAPRPSERELRFPRFDQIAYPAWSVTGRLAVGVGQSAFSGHVATVAPSGKDLHLVTRSTRDSLPDWSPTADRIVFQRWKDNPADDAINPKRSDILVASARARRTNRPVRLTHTRDAFSPVWSPDGRDIAYVRGLTFNSGSLAILRARDGAQRRLIANHVEVFSRISWQPRPRR